MVLLSPDIERLGVGETLPPMILEDMVRVVRTEAEAEAEALFKFSVFAALVALVGTLPEVEFVEIAAGLVDRLSTDLEDED